MEDFRITPRDIDRLMYNEIYVFNANLAGKHLHPSAKLAKEKFGAIEGKGKGLQGQSYAIPFRDENLKKMPLDLVERYINEFITFAKDNPNKIFLVTEIGTGIGEFKYTQVAELLKETINMKNIKLPSPYIAHIITPKRDFKRIKWQLDGTGIL